MCFSCVTRDVYIVLWMCTVDSVIVVHLRSKRGKFDREGPIDRIGNIWVYIYIEIGGY